MKNTRIIILNYNGLNIMKECMPSVVEAARNAKPECKVSIIDNSSTDDSVRWLKNAFPSVDVFESENKVLCSYNDFVRTVREDIVILLNNDVKLDRNCVDPLIGVFEKNPDAFFAASRVFDFSGKKYEGNLTRFFFRGGLFGSEAVFKGFESLYDKPGLSMQQGFGAFDREKFLALGGYDEIYLPGRLEDADICFRAWKRGWKGYYEPSSVMYHKGGETFNSRFGANKSLALNFRNTYVFTVKNLELKYVFLSLVLALPRSLYFLCRLRPENLAGFVHFIPMAAKALKKRKHRFKSGYKDSDLFNMIPCGG
ncbi:MAG: glycosyltransferase [bacterium]|nr:glycosyltransferase [bacterium]